MLSSARIWTAMYVAAVIAFAAMVAPYYHRGHGLTFFIELTEAGHPYEVPAVRDAPHYDHADSGGYDGQYYAQIATEPLLRDGAIDREMDNPPYRARRILTAWTAWAIGAGRPAWILQVYALQNVVVWLVIGIVLCRWLPPTGARHFALWSACLFSHGLLSSVRYALPDGPAALLVTAAVAAPAPVWSAVWIGLAGLARETGLLAVAVFVPLLMPPRRRVVLAAACVLLAVLPLALWTDYLRSIYRSDAFVSAGHVTTPLSGVVWKIQNIRHDIQLHGFTYQNLASAAALTGFLVQGAIVLHAVVRSRGRSVWACVGAAFLALALVTDYDVFAGTPGAFTRAFLPLTIAANVLLAGRPGASSWPLIVLANLAVVPGVLMLSIGWG